VAHNFVFRKTVWGTQEINLCTLKQRAGRRDDAGDMRLGVEDRETYERVDGVWMFRHKRSEPLMNVPFETGWAKARFM
jgi:hypothetical protein